MSFRVTVSGHTPLSWHKYSVHPIYPLRCISYPSARSQRMLQWLSDKSHLAERKRERRRMSWLKKEKYTSATFAEMWFQSSQEATATWFAAARTCGNSLRKKSANSKSKGCWRLLPFSGRFFPSGDHSRKKRRNPHVTRRLPFSFVLPFWPWAIRCRIHSEADLLLILLSTLPAPSEKAGIDGHNYR